MAYDILVMNLTYLFGVVLGRRPEVLVNPAWYWLDSTPRVIMALGAGQLLHASLGQVLLHGETQESDLSTGPPHCLLFAKCVGLAI